MSQRSKNKNKRKPRSKGTGRKSGAKGWRSAGPGTTSVSMLGGFSDRCRVRLSYISHFTFSTTTTPSDQIMRGNSVFDPDFTGTGGQPNNFDDFALHYGSFRVYGSTCKLWCAMGTGQGELTLAARRSSTSIVLLSTLESAQSEPYCRHRTVGPNLFVKGTTPVLSMSVQTQKILAVPITDPDMSALTTTNPNRAFFWHVIFNSYDFSTSTTAVINVEVVYDVEFFVRLEGTLDLRLERMLLLRNIKRVFDERKEGKLNVKEKEGEDSTDSGTGPPRPRRYSPDEVVTVVTHDTDGRLEHSTPAWCLQEQAPAQVGSRQPGTVTQYRPPPLYGGVGCGVKRAP